jgi:2-acylglycerol O-acyltransferase 2
MANKDSNVLIDSSGCSLLATISGALTVLIFIVTWLASLTSPILLWRALVTQSHKAAGAILVLTAAAYIPWKKGPVSATWKYVLNTYHPQYYKRCKVIFEESTPNEADRPTFYAIHPHGAFCLGWSVLFASYVMENVRFCFSPALYFSPFFKLFCRITGKPGKADKASMIGYMKRGENLALPPGGFEEATLLCSTVDRVYIKKRVGFVKLCLQHGYNIVPVYCFGERSTYKNIQGFWNMRLGMNNMGVPAILIWGASFFPLMPRRPSDGLYIVAGKPLSCPKIEKPTRDEVKLWHDKYIAALVQIFEENKCDAYGDSAKTLKLEIW